MFESFFKNFIIISWDHILGHPQTWQLGFQIPAAPIAEGIVTVHVSKELAVGSIMNLNCTQNIMFFSPFEQFDSVTWVILDFFMYFFMDFFMDFFIDFFIDFCVIVITS